MIPEQIARTCYNVNREIRLALGEDKQLAPSWEDAPEWQRITVRDGVQAVLDGRITEAGQSHQNWLDMKEKDGWKYGPVRDVEKGEHPCMLPFDELPLEQQLKDVLFLNIVQALQ
jgi:hypothetical protein